MLLVMYFVVGHSSWPGFPKGRRLEVLDRRPSEASGLPEEKEEEEEAVDGEGIDPTDVLSDISPLLWSPSFQTPGAHLFQAEELLEAQLLKIRGA